MLTHMGYFSRDRRLYRSLVSAIKKQDLEGMKKLVSEGAALEKPAGERSGGSPLFEAAGVGFVEGIRFLIQKGALPDVRDDGRTPLQQAVYHKHKEAIRALVAAGADINAPMYSKRTVLHEAQEHYNYDLFPFLLEQGANINAQKDDGQTVLHIAAKGGRSEHVTLFLDHGADATVTDRHMNTAADVAQKDYPKIAELIRSRAAPQKPPEPAAGWQLTAPDEVARVTEKKGIGYRVTEIFNFNARLYTHIAQNMATGAESQTVKGFADLDDGSILVAARAALAQLGGRLPENKKRLPARGQGG